MSDLNLAVSDMNAEGKSSFTPTKYDPIFFNRFGIQTSIIYVNDLILENGLEKKFQKDWSAFYKKHKKRVLNWREKRFQGLLNKIRKSGSDEEYCKRIEIRYIDREVGYGVYAKEDIPANSILNHYTGILRLDDKIEDGNDSTFTFEDFTKFSIDAVRAGNWTRFMNHTDESAANVAAWEYYTEDGPRIVFTAKSKGIKKGDQLLYSYGEEYWEEDEVFTKEFDL